MNLVGKWKVCQMMSFDSESGSLVYKTKDELSAQGDENEALRMFGTLVEFTEDGEVIKRIFTVTNTLSAPVRSRSPPLGMDRVTAGVVPCIIVPLLLSSFGPSFVVFVQNNTSLLSRIEYLFCFVKLSCLLQSSFLYCA